MIRRYKREQEGGSRPALRLIAAHDAPSSAPLVLCVSNIFWTDESVDANGRLVPAHPELEVTDGWYRLRAAVDEALARAARSKILRIGRKIACSGAKVCLSVHRLNVFALMRDCHQLESSKKDPMEVLDAYGSVQLILSGNSTHLAPWHAKLGFQNAPFVATLRSLTSDGGMVPLVDVIITKVNSSYAFGNAAERPCRRFLWAILSLLQQRTANQFVKGHGPKRTRL
jgi:breast cancer 2 susceptibility protein